MNASEITVVQNRTEDYKAIAIDYLRGMGMKLPQRFEMQFIGLCQAYGLNPLKREIYAVGYGDNYNVITGYEVYLKRAERTGKLDGWECHVDGEGDHMIAKLTIYRKDWKMPFTHEVFFSEAVQRKRDGSVNSMWQKMPAFMLRKVAIAQGFRLCFPDELGGMPYTSDELPEEEKNITPEKKTEEDDTSSKIEVGMKLESLVSKYERQLQGRPYELAVECLRTNGDFAEMYGRVKEYLAKKGITV